VPTRPLEAPPPGRALRLAVIGSSVGKAIEVATLVLLATLVPRELGPSDFGEFSVALTLVTLGSLALTLGGPTLMARFVPVAPQEERAALARAIGIRLARGRTVQVVVLAFVVLAVLVVDPSVMEPDDAMIVFTAFALNVITSIALQVALGLGRTVPWSLRYPLQNAVLIVGVLALHPAYGLQGTLVAILISAAVGAAFAAVVVVRVAGGPLPRVPVPDGALRFGALQAAAAALVQFMQRGGVVAVAVLTASSRQVGYAALAIGIVLGATYAILQAFTVSLPHLAEHLGPDRATDAVETTLRRLAAWTLAPVLVACAVAALTLDELVPAVFGDDFAGAVPAFRPALALLVLAPIAALFTQAAALRLRPSAALVSASVGAGTFVVAALAMVPTWGAAGATGAALAGGVAAAIASTACLPRAAGRALTAVSFGGAAVVFALATT
jgi:O-antigen/teichoic acid export membrane protein